MSKTLEEILREEVLKETNGMEYEHNVTHKGIIRAMERYAQSQTQELQEQNAELVGLLKKCRELMENSIFTPHKNTASVITQLLTKYNHLKTNTNEKL